MHTSSIKVVVFLSEYISAMNCGNSQQFNKVVSVINRIEESAPLQDDIRF